MLSTDSELSIEGGLKQAPLLKFHPIVRQLYSRDKI